MQTALSVKFVLIFGFAVLVLTIGYVQGDSETRAGAVSGAAELLGDRRYVQGVSAPGSGSRSRQCANTRG